MSELWDMYEKCSLCPRGCYAGRRKERTGICQVTGKLKCARAALHFWEEPCISGTNGSGAVFFSGCPLHCIFCQNEEISHGRVGKEITPERLTEIFLELQDKKANNINLVTAGQYLPHVIYAVEHARNQGLRIPVIYNSSGYENVESLKMLEGIVDVYLPDFKYMDPALAARYSHAVDYPQKAMAALKEMFRQQPQCYFYPENTDPQDPDIYGTHAVKEADDGYLIRNGVIVRQLLLPGHIRDAKNIVKYLYETYQDRIYLSLMSQYTPMPHLEAFPELCRKVSEEEYEEYVDYAINLGVEYGFIQEGDVAEESFIPDFDCEGV